MTRHISNAFYGVLDYAAYPIVMLAAAPLMLHLLGASGYGLWMIAGAILSVGGILASGFSDANLRQVASFAAVGDLPSAAASVRSILSINLAVASIVAVTVTCVAPHAAARIEANDPEALRSCVLVICLSAFGIVVRALLSVAVSTQRAFQQFRSVTLINTLLHVVSLVSAVVLALEGFHLAAIVAANILCLCAALVAQWWQMQRLLCCRVLRPSRSGPLTRGLLHDGSFLWLQTLAAVASDRLDRIILGLSLGAAAVAPYSLCLQLAQPLCGITASALSFLFPYFAQLAATSSVAQLRHSVLNALAVNLALIAFGLGALLAVGRPILDHWVGHSVGVQANTLLLPVALGSASVGASVTGIYVMQAVGRFRTLALVSLATRTTALCLMFVLLHRYGLRGLAISRLVTGASALLVYVPAWSTLRPAAPASGYSIPRTLPMGEGGEL